jgi:hypothetical protein
MTTLTRMTPAPLWWLEQITRWFNQNRSPYHWYEVENCGIW